MSEGIIRHYLTREQTAAIEAEAAAFAKAEIEKSELLAREKIMVAEMVKRNREKRAEAEREQNEINFKASARHAFMESNPDASESDFLKNFPEIQRQNQIENYNRQVANSRPAWESVEMN